ncbi:MAG: serine dehydratase subunit alpha family protein, partial [Paludibacteraceae bacterium]|nr:serine dehydratase subunit alpha family protein [Paludibacteraceae bacterium]
MKKSDPLYTSYLNILKEELVPAMGCTEPISLAYAAAKARTTLGTMPDKVEIEASSNIIKNVKSVVVPNTDKLKGLKASVASGIVAGNPDKSLEVIANVTPEDKQKINQFLDSTPITIVPLDKIAQLDITVRLYGNGHTAAVRIAGHHTNIVSIQKDGKELFHGQNESTNANMTDRSCLRVDKIYDFVETADIEDIKAVVGEQIHCNKAISMEGLKNTWGANVGSTLLRYGNDIRQKAKAWAAAGSDARMSGCEMPVIINSGSGNQG